MTNEVNAPDRFVVLALAHGRAAWLRDLSRIVNSGAIPIELILCVSASEIRARLLSGRPHSAAFLDATSPAVDRALVADLNTFDCPAILVDTLNASSVSALGAAGSVALPIEPTEVLDQLIATCLKVRSAHSFQPADDVASFDVRAKLVAVCDAGGAQGSVIAARIAEGLALTNTKSKPIIGEVFGDVVLVDGLRRATQAMLHNTLDFTPSIIELAEFHRHHKPSRETIRSHSFVFAERPYSLILGMRNSLLWSSTRGPLLEAALGSLAANYAMMICEIDPDFEGAVETGSQDIAERHTIARWAARNADVVVVTCNPDVTGLFGAIATIRALIHFGVDAQSIIPVVTRSPRLPSERADIARSLSLSSDAVATSPALFLSKRAPSELASLASSPRDAKHFSSLITAVSIALKHAAPHNEISIVNRDDEAVAITPGTLGTQAF